MVCCHVTNRRIKLTAGSHGRRENSLCHGDPSLSADTRHQAPRRQDPAHASSSEKASRRRLCGVDIGQREVPPFEQQRLAGRLRQRVGEAVAKVQSRRVVAFAEPPPGPTGGLRMVRGDRLQLDRRLFQEEVKLVPGCGATATLEDDGRLQEAGGRYAATRSADYRPLISLGVRLAK